MTRAILILSAAFGLILLQLAGDEIADSAWVIAYGLACAWLGRACDRVTGGETGDLPPPHMAIHRPGDLRIRFLGNALTRLK